MGYPWMCLGGCLKMKWTVHIENVWRLADPPLTSCISPDGDYIAFGGAGFLTLSSVTNGRNLWSFSTQHTVAFCCFSLDSSLVAATLTQEGGATSIVLVNRSSGDARRLLVVDPAKTPGLWVDPVCHFGVGNNLAVRTQAGVKFLDIRKAKEMQCLGGETSSQEFTVTALAPLIVLSYRMNGAPGNVYQIMNYINNKVIRCVGQALEEIVACVLSTDGELMVTGSRRRVGGGVHGVLGAEAQRGSVVKVTDVHSGDVLLTLEYGAVSLTNLAISGDKQSVAVMARGADGDVLSIFETASGKNLLTRYAGSDFDTANLSFALNSSRLLVTNSRGDLFVWRLDPLWEKLRLLMLARLRLPGHFLRVVEDSIFESLISFLG
eukprot:GILK01003058.1.p1 GENE.GILK01003058.1~~GILK01003058.1.p1  ORF type:complete len:378 (-),score=29.95 GILK01003058.1:260-1393(-)